MKHAKRFMFSVDLEDVRDGVTDGYRYKEAVPSNTKKYLDWLRRYGFKCTFFVTGRVAVSYPSLIRQIVEEGHELACHTMKHIPLTSYSPDEFRKDLEENKSVLLKFGAKEITGFRAPSYSLVPETKWVYEILSEQGFLYSSSVHPGKNPLFGWPGFSDQPCLIGKDLIELPITLFELGPIKLPVAGGIYFRVFPFFLIKHYIIATQNRNQPVIGYLHPYDIDTEQERFMHGGINGNRFYNSLMYYNRADVFNRLDKLLSCDMQIIPYSELVKELTDQNELRVCKA